MNTKRFSLFNSLWLENTVLNNEQKNNKYLCLINIDLSDIISILINKTPKCITNNKINKRIISIFYVWYIADRIFNNSIRDYNIIDDFLYIIENYIYTNYDVDYDINNLIYKIGFRENYYLDNEINLVYNKIENYIKKISYVYIKLNRFNVELEPLYDYINLDKYIFRIYTLIRLY